MADEPTSPNDEHIALTGSSSSRSMARGDMTQTSDTPPPLRNQFDPAIFSNWDQPQPLPRRPNLIPGGPSEPPFPPPANADVPIVGEVAFDARQSSFQTLEARVAVLEAALLSRPAGVGHNRGPSLNEDLSIDEAGIQHLIALLKEQRATTPVELPKLTEAAQVADPKVNKWRERLDTFVKGAIFAAGKKAGDALANQMADAAWFQSVYSALQGVFEAVMAWISLF